MGCFCADGKREIDACDHQSSRQNLTNFQGILSAAYVTVGQSDAQKYGLPI